MRHRVPVEILKTLDGRSALVYAVNQDWIGKDDVMDTELGEVTISASKATSEVVIRGSTYTDHFQFTLEEGTWKFDLAALMAASNSGMVDAVKSIGRNENEFIFTMIEAESGLKLTAEIWNPLL